MIPTGQEEEGEDQGIIHTSQLTTDFSRGITQMICLGQTHSSEWARLGLLHRLLALDVADAEGLEDGAEGEDKSRGNGRYGTFSKDIAE